MALLSHERCFLLFWRAFCFPLAVCRMASSSRQSAFRTALAVDDDLVVVDDATETEEGTDAVVAGAAVATWCSGGVFSWLPGMVCVEGHNGQITHYGGCVMGGGSFPLSRTVCMPFLSCSGPTSTCFCPPRPMRQNQQRASPPAPLCNEALNLWHCGPAHPKRAWLWPCQTCWDYVLSRLPRIGRVQ